MGNLIDDLVQVAKRAQSAPKMLHVARPAEKVSDESKGRHWYLFAFSGIEIESGRQCQASTYTGFPDKEITLAIIQEQKRNAGVTRSAVPIAVNYLGWMTKEEFTLDAEENGGD